MSSVDLIYEVVKFPFNTDNFYYNFDDVNMDQANLSKIIKELNNNEYSKESTFNYFKSYFFSFTFYINFFVDFLFGVPVDVNVEQVNIIKKINVSNLMELSEKKLNFLDNRGFLDVSLESLKEEKIEKVSICKINNLDSLLTLPAELVEELYQKKFLKLSVEDLNKLFNSKKVQLNKADTYRLNNTYESFLEFMKEAEAEINNCVLKRIESENKITVINEVYSKLEAEYEVIRKDLRLSRVKNLAKYTELGKYVNEMKPIIKSNVFPEYLQSIYPFSEYYVEIKFLDLTDHMKEIIKNLRTVGRVVKQGFREKINLLQDSFTQRSRNVKEQLKNLERLINTLIPRTDYSERLYTDLEELKKSFEEYEDLLNKVNTSDKCSMERARLYKIILGIDKQLENNNIHLKNMYDYASRGIVDNEENIKYHKNMENSIRNNRESKTI